MKQIMPGDRVMVFDTRLFKNDVDTPLSHTVRPATVVRRYGYKRLNLDRTGYWTYSDLVDVRFDHRPDDISGGHFTDGVKLIG